MVLHSAGTLYVHYTTRGRASRPRQRRIRHADRGRLAHVCPGTTGLTAASFACYLGIKDHEREAARRRRLAAYA